MNAIEFKKKLDGSLGLMMIVSGLTTLVEQEGYTPHEAFRMLEDIKRNTFHALSDIREGVVENATVD